MKNVISLLALMFSVLLCYSQKSNIVLFTEQGERFTVILNGIRQNPSPETNVKVTGLNLPSYKLKVIFEDKNIPDVDKTITFNQGTETNYIIKKNNKGQYVVRWMNEVPAEQAPVPAQGQDIIVYTTVPPPASTTTTITQTESTTMVNKDPGPVQGGGASVGINVQDPSSGVSFNMNVNAGAMNSHETTSSTTTTITTTTSSGSGYVSPPPAPVPPAQQHYIMQGYNGPVGCPWPIAPKDFQAIKQSISSKKFEDSKLTIAKEVISTNCLLSSQVKEIMLLFTFEETRLDLAKYAYGFTYDTGNYYRLNDAFTFESSIEELNQYISSMK